MSAAELVGSLEVAARLGVSVNTLASWRRRGTDAFPPAEHVVGGRPAWKWSTVKAWATRTGRMPQPPAKGDRSSPAARAHGLELLEGGAS